MMLWTHKSNNLEICIIFLMTFMKPTIFTYFDIEDILATFSFDYKVQCQRHCWYTKQCGYFSYKQDKSDFNCVLHKLNLQGKRQLRMI